MSTIEKIITGIFIGSVVAFFTLVAADITASVLAYDKTLACEVKQMVPRRRSFTTDVTCVPSLTRKDTLYIDTKNNTIYLNGRIK